MKRNSLAYLLGIISLSLFLFAGYLVSEHFQSKSLTFAQVSTTNNSSTQIIHIKIPSAEISLPVSEQPLSNNKFPLSKDSVIHIKDTNIYYAHNWANLFGNLIKVKNGDKIFLNDKISYTVSQVKNIKPAQDTLPDNNHEIILYTCTGFLDSQRLVVIATLDL